MSEKALEKRVNEVIAEWERKAGRPLTAEEVLAAGVQAMFTKRGGKKK